MRIFVIGNFSLAIWDTSLRNILLYLHTRGTKTLPRIYFGELEGWHASMSPAWTRLNNNTGCSRRGPIFELHTRESPLATDSLTHRWMSNVPGACELQTWEAYPVHVVAEYPLPLAKKFALMTLSTALCDHQANLLMKWCVGKVDISLQGIAYHTDVYHTLLFREFTISFHLRQM